MRKLLLSLLMLVALPVAAQFTPPPAPGANATVGFFSIGKTSWLAASGTSSNVALSNVASQGFTQVQVYNAGTTIAFVACSPSATITASAGTAGSAATDYPVAPGAVIVMSVSGGTGFCAAVMASSTAAVYFTPGVGL